MGFDVCIQRVMGQYQLHPGTNCYFFPKSGYKRGLPHFGDISTTALILRRKTTVVSKYIYGFLCLLLQPAIKLLFRFR